jgi:hypothetical protein
MSQVYGLHGLLQEQNELHLLKVQAEVIQHPSGETDFLRLLVVCNCEWIQSLQLSCPLYILVFDLIAQLQINNTITYRLKYVSF